MTKRIAALAASLILTLMASLSIVSPAQAVPTDCSSGTICMYLNGTNPYAIVSSTSGGVPRNQCMAAAEQTGISYVYNRTSTRWFVFRAAGCGGSHLEVPPGYAGQIQALVGGSGWDNDVTHMFRTSTTTLN